MSTVTDRSSGPAATTDRSSGATAATAASGREGLLAAGAELFFTRGFDDVTVAQLAEHAGVAYGLVAHHFGSKRGLYLAVVRSTMDELRALRQEPLIGDDPAAQLRFGVRRHFGFVIAHRDAYLSLMQGGLGMDREVRDIVDEVRWDGARLVLEGLGAESPLDPALRGAMCGWVAFLDGLLIDHLQHGEQLDVDALVELAVAALAGALTAVHEASRGSAPIRLQ